MWKYGSGVVPDFFDFPTANPKPTNTTEVII